MTKKDFDRIAQRYGTEYLYRQLAEEATELAQAALKVIRAVRKETPTSVDEARLRLLEEMADLRVMMDLLYSFRMTKSAREWLEDMRAQKDRRMVERLLGGAK